MRDLGKDTVLHDFRIYTVSLECLIVIKSVVVEYEGPNGKER